MGWHQTLAPLRVLEPLYAHMSGETHIPWFANDLPGQCRRTLEMRSRCITALNIRYTQLISLTILNPALAARASHTSNYLAVQRLRKVYSLTVLPNI